MENKCKFTPSDIKKIRLDLMLTQTEFAEKLGISFASVNRYENGKSIPTLKVQRKFLELSKKEIK
ncbi:MAG: helix-turn-helix domain-containing protein [Erysipelotrichaceae bacterium]|nr:helix-turn-helix domain-containing protein [Erysipelotrichaceae bacterium]